MNRESTVELPARRRADLLPGPEPTLVPFAERTPDGERRRIIPVCDVDLGGRELEEVQAAVESGWISSAGPAVGRFEEAFASAVGCRCGVACSSGTAALHLALAALGIGPGDEVILPTFTMIAVANSVLYTGATPVLVDCAEGGVNLDPAAVAARLGSRTRAVIAVHTYGRPAPVRELAELVAGSPIALVEDASEAHGATSGGRPVGSLGTIGTFSFYANKIIATGEGGMVTTNDAALADRARLLRDHAFSAERHFWHRQVGFNYRITALQAAIGIAQTERLAELVERRRRIARRYAERLASVPGITLATPVEGDGEVCWMVCVEVDDALPGGRDGLRRRLAERGIETRSYFIPIHLQPVYADRFRSEFFPVADELCRRGLYLPSGPGLSTADLDRVAAAIAEAAGAADPPTPVVL